MARRTEPACQLEHEAGLERHVRYIARGETMPIPNPAARHVRAPWEGEPAPF